MFDAIYFIGNIMSWSIIPLLEKGAIRHSNYIDMSMLRYILPGLITFFIYLFYKDFKNLFKYNSFVYVRMITVAILGFCGVFLNYNLLSKYDANFVYSIVTPLSLISLMILASCFFGEKISMKRAFGMIIVAIGIFIIHSTKDN